MKVTQFGPGSLPLALAGWSSGFESIGSNADTFPGLSALNFVQRITANSSNVLLNPIINFASGSNILLTLDQGPLPGQAYPSNTIRIHSTATGGGSVSYGSNATRVSEIASVGALPTVAREDHIHDGIGTITASSSNTMQRGTFNMRSGTNISFGLTDTDGDGELDTMTINASATGGGAGSSSGLVLLASLTASSSSSLDFATRNATGQSGNMFASDYDVYEVTVQGFTPATDGAVPRLRFSTDGGSTYDTSTIYHWTNSHQQFGTGTITGTFESSKSYIALFSDSAGTGLESTAAQQPALVGRFHIYNPLGALNKHMDGIGVAVYNSGTGVYYQYTMGGVYLSTTAVNAFRIIMSSGNISAGTIRVYGLAV